MNFGDLSANNHNNYNPHFNNNSATTTDMFVDRIANPDKLPADPINFEENPKAYYDSDDEYQPDDHTGNYTNENEDDNNSVENHTEHKKMVYQLKRFPFRPKHKKRYLTQRYLYKITG